MCKVLWMQIRISTFPHTASGQVPCSLDCPVILQSNWTLQSQAEIKCSHLYFGWGLSKLGLFIGKGNYIHIDMYQEKIFMCLTSDAANGMCALLPFSALRGAPGAEAKADSFLNLSLSVHSQQLFNSSGNPGTSPMLWSQLSGPLAALDLA